MVTNREEKLSVQGLLVCVGGAGFAETIGKGREVCQDVSFDASG